MSALPGDPTFNPLDNHYDMASYKRICAEFGIDPLSDFCFKRGKNHGLGRVNGEAQLDFKYPGWMKFSVEGGKAITGNHISYICPDPVSMTSLPQNNLWLDASGPRASSWGPRYTYVTTLSEPVGE